MTCVTINRALCLSSSKSCRNAFEFSLRKGSPKIDNIIISLVGMLKMRHSDSDETSYRQPCGRVCPGFSHDISTAVDRVIMEIPSSHPQNKELLFFSDTMGLHGCQYHVFWVPTPALLLCYPFKCRDFELLTPRSHEHGKLQRN